MNKYVIKIQSDIQIIDVDEPDNVLVMHGASAEEYGGEEESIPMTEQTIKEGLDVAGWMGYGTEIDRTFEDDKRKIEQHIKVEQYRLVIENSIEYKAEVKINFEGFKFSGHTYWDKFKNVYATGTGQNIIGAAGMFFHNGEYTAHRVIADINTLFKWKQYNNSDTESTKMYFVDGDNFVPLRILAQPDGYNASLTISNHADGGGVDRQKAVHYGTSNDGDPNYGSKGFAARGILSDWTVFAEHASINSPGFIDNQDYLDFLQELKSGGNEIIPHSFRDPPDSRIEAESYLPVFQSEFAPSNWTDHALGSGNLTAGISSKGWDESDTDNYMLDLFEANGFNKAWAYQDYSNHRMHDTVWGFNHDIAYFNDHLRLPTSNESVFLWKASSNIIYNGLLSIVRLINRADTVDCHAYTTHRTREASEDTDNSRYTFYDDNGTLKITSGFDAFLQEIEQKKADGEIWNPTTTDWCEYFKKIKKVQIEIIDKETYKVINSGDQIDGFTILVCKPNITAKINTTDMNTKDAEMGTICWGDLPAGESEIKISED